MVDGVVFDNFLITSDQSIAKQYDDQLWYPKSILEGKAISAASESVIDAIVNATKDRPWLWAVYLIAILLPIIILIVFCWTKKSPKKSADGIRKKTDAAVSDVNDEPMVTRADEDDVVDEEIEIDEQQTTTRVKVVTSKVALESDEQQDAEVNVRIYHTVTSRLSSLSL